MREPAADKERYRIEVGHTHGVKPGNIVGAIANESGIAGEHIGHITINSEFSLVDLPAGMPQDVYRDLKKVRVCGEALKISRTDKANPYGIRAGKGKSDRSKFAKTKRTKVKSPKAKPRAKGKLKLPTMKKAGGKKAGATRTK